MRWETVGVARFIFSSSLHGSVVGNAKCLRCAWQLRVTGGQSFNDLIEKHVLENHADLVNESGVLSTPEGDDVIDYFVAKRPVVSLANPY